MKRKVITIEVTAEEVDALEDIFFCKLSEEQWERLYDAKNSLWEKVATAFDSESKWAVELLESLDEDQLKELLSTAALITDPLSQELIKYASSKGVDKEGGKVNGD